MTLQTEILPTVASDFLKQMIILKAFIGCFGLNGPLRQYFNLYRAVSQREGERKEKW